MNQNTLISLHPHGDDVVQFSALLNSSKLEIISSSTFDINQSRHGYCRSWIMLGGTFTPINLEGTRELPTEQIRDLLTDMQNYYDRTIELYDFYKPKTMGDMFDVFIDDQKKPQLPEHITQHNMDEWDNSDENDMGQDELDDFVWSVSPDDEELKLNFSSLDNVYSTVSNMETGKCERSIKIEGTVWDGDDAYDVYFAMEFDDKLSNSAINDFVPMLMVEIEENHGVNLYNVIGSALDRPHANSYYFTIKQTTGEGIDRHFGL